MPMKWKFPQFIDSNNITVYALAQKLEGEVTITTLYNLKNKEQKRIDLSTLNALIPALAQLTGKKVGLTDLLEYQEEG